LLQLVQRVPRLLDNILRIKKATKTKMPDKSDR
jgi:hypothetical protein